jgi:urease accessory protein
MRSRTRWTVLIAFMLSLWWAPPASAHLLTTGFGPFYDGLAHLFVTPEDLLPVAAIALLAGLRGPRYGRGVLFVLPAAWFAGSLAGRLLSPGAALPAATAVLTIALGALAAADRPLPFWTVAGLAAALGLWNGGLNGTELAKAHASALPSLGVACALFAVVALVAGNVVSVRAAWARVAVRVAGSWIAASGLFMLGWSLRGR